MDATIASEVMPAEASGGIAMNLKIPTPLTIEHGELHAELVYPAAILVGRVIKARLDA